MPLNELQNINREERKKRTLKTNEKFNSNSSLDWIKLFDDETNNKYEKTPQIKEADIDQLSIPVESDRCVSPVVVTKPSNKNKVPTSSFNKPTMIVISDRKISKSSIKIIKHVKNNVEKIDQSNTIAPQTQKFFNHNLDEENKENNFDIQLKKSLVEDKAAKKQKNYVNEETKLLKKAKLDKNECMKQQSHNLTPTVSTCYSFNLFEDEDLQETANSSECNKNKKATKKYDYSYENELDEFDEFDFKNQQEFKKNKKRVNNVKHKKTVLKFKNFTQSDQEADKVLIKMIKKNAKPINYGRGRKKIEEINKLEDEEAKKNLDDWERELKEIQNYTLIVETTNKDD